MKNEITNNDNFLNNIIIEILEFLQIHNYIIPEVDINKYEMIEDKSKNQQF